MGTFVQNHVERIKGEALFCSGVILLIESYYAVAPGPGATMSYQYLSARLSAGTGMLSARVGKSTVIKAVMSAVEKVSPALKATSVSLVSMSHPLEKKFPSLPNFAS